MICHNLYSMLLDLIYIVGTKGKSRNSLAIYMQTRVVNQILQKKSFVGGREGGSCNFQPSIRGGPSI